MQDLKTVLTLGVIILFLYLLFQHQCNASKAKRTNKTNNEQDLDELNNMLEHMEDVNLPQNNEMGENNTHKNVSYADGNRGNNVNNANFDKYFNNESILTNNGNNDEFNPMDETNGNFSSYEQQEERKNNQDVSPADLFDPDRYLPKENYDDWLETQPDAIDVKNRHLINTVKPIGVISQTNRNASHDLRSAPPCPKFVVSPWQQSTIEPDTNIKAGSW